MARFGITAQIDRFYESKNYISKVTSQISWLIIYSAEVNTAYTSKHKAIITFPIGTKRTILSHYSEGEDPRKQRPKSRPKTQKDDTFIFFI